jgi:DNA topoisomerase I
MGENLVIVESPAKAKTIEKFLGKDYIVRSSFGHIRDLSKKNLGIDIENGFNPEYIVSADKKKIVTTLKEDAKKAKTIWIASDEDREGEAIAWHLFETLQLKDENTKRIVFHEITKDAILNAIDNPRSIDMNLVMAQQARRVLDRLVGFELSPILWKKIKPSLSAGRVQSVALRLIVDREREILSFKSEPYLKAEGIFHPEGAPSKTTIKGSYGTKIASLEEAEIFLENCKNSKFHISSIEKKENTRTPAPPFTTSLLQQEASRKFGFSVSQTMSVAQHLYENGLITYMRTDSTNLSKLAINSAKTCICELYGEKYSNPRQYKTKSKGAQEAHEAIRPTYLNRTEIEGTATEKKLYNLIWKRTISSQMSDAKVEKTNIIINGDKLDDVFTTQGTKIIFDGFLKVYMESRDDDKEGEEMNILPSLSLNQNIERIEISTTQKYTSHPSRYSEATLVKKMEELGIGRPSTYAPTISTIHNRGYISKGDRKGEEKEITTLTLIGDKITSNCNIESIGSEKGKLSPEDIGIMVTDFLEEYFSNIIDYGFTAKVEENFDKIAQGKLQWNKTIEQFYKTFHERVTTTLTEAQPKKNERFIGIDPKSGKNIIARMGRFGALVQIGDNDDPDKKYSGLKKGQLIESITLEDALKLFELPRHLGKYNDKEIVISIGRFGPYIKFGTSFISLKKGTDPYSVTLDETIAMIEENKVNEEKKHIKEFKEEGIQILNGRFGPYIKFDGKNFKIPKNTEAKSLSLEQCKEIIVTNSNKEKKNR